MSRKTYDLTNPSDIDELRRLVLLDDVEENSAEVEDLGGESDIASEDEVAEDEDDQPTVDSFFIGKDKKTKWLKKPPSAIRSARPQNILTHLPGVKGNARNCKTKLECRNCLFTEDILEMMIKYTNQYIDTIKHKFTRERDANHTDLIEIRAFIGLLYLAGAYRAKRQSLEELWGTEGDGIEKFALVMNLKRFKFLIRCLRFDDQSTRAQ